MRAVIIFCVGESKLLRKSLEHFVSCQKIECEKLAYLFLLVRMHV